MEQIVAALTKWVADSTPSIASGIAISGGVGLLFKYGRRLFR